MTTEKGQKTNPKDVIDSARLEFLEKSFNHSSGLNEDSLNVWIGVLARLGHPLDLIHFEKLVPLLNYREYIQRMHGHDPNEFEFVMDKSNPEAVKQFDALVDEFNTRLEELKANQDPEEIKGFFNRAERLIKGKV